MEDQAPNDRLQRPAMPHGYSSQEYVTNEKMHPSPANPARKHVLPTKMIDGKLKTRGIQQDGESGRSGFHPYHFLRVAWYEIGKILLVLL